MLYKNINKINDLGNLSTKKILLRCDFNVPIDNGTIVDDGRIRSSLPTIKKLLKDKAKLIICAHLGRPKIPYDNQYSLKIIAKHLEKLIGQKVFMSDDVIGECSKRLIQKMKSGEIVLLENLRFHKEETSNIASERYSFALQLAKFADLYISDGFGILHRKQASVYEVATMLPSAIGLLVEQEIEKLNSIAKNPNKPFVVVLGGSKVSDKIQVVEHLLPKADYILIGGGMCFTFLKAKGYNVGKSLVENKMLDKIKGLSTKDNYKKIILPQDIVVASSFSKNAKYESVDVREIENTQFGINGIGLDNGPKTNLQFSHIISSAKTIFWNGPMGVFEFKSFKKGTQTVAQAIKESSSFSIIGGGDSAAAIRNFGFKDSDFGYVSTGGGASLEFMKGKSMPGIEILKNKKVNNIK